jgi:hypothetical protein
MLPENIKEGQRDIHLYILTSDMVTITNEPVVLYARNYVSRQTRNINTNSMLNIF